MYNALFLCWMSCRQLECVFRTSSDLGWAVVDVQVKRFLSFPGKSDTNSLTLERWMDWLVCAGNPTKNLESECTQQAARPTTALLRAIPMEIVLLQNLRNNVIEQRSMLRKFLWTSVNKHVLLCYFNSLQFFWEFQEFFQSICYESRFFDYL